ncbi:MAG: deoxyribonuclease, partial [Candidatus Thiodiazotropha sp.]
QAAFALASLYDPNHFKPGNELLASPDVYQAHKWYLEAEKQQLPEARERLLRLRSNIETQAQSGDSDAQRLLLNWQ